MKKRFMVLAVAAALFCLFPSASSALRPSMSDNLMLLFDMYQEAEFFVSSGEFKSAEAILIEIHQLTEADKGRSESHWFAHLQALRKLVCFYCETGMYREAAWYYSEYASELQGDEDELSLHLMLEQGIIDVIGLKAASGDEAGANAAFEFLTGQLESRFGGDCYLLEVLYLNRAAFCRNYGKLEKARYFSARAEEVRRASEGCVK
jgi:hypothetical protein